MWEKACELVCAGYSVLERRDCVLTNKRKSATRDGCRDEREKNSKEHPKTLVKTTQGLRRIQRLLCFQMHDETPRDRPKTTYEVRRFVVCRILCRMLPDFQSSAYRNRRALSLTLAVPKKQKPQTFPVSSSFPRLRLSCRTKATTECGIRNGPSSSFVSCLPMI